jgi:hypothetical protein
MRPRKRSGVSAWRKVGHYCEEDAQVVGIGPHRVGTGPPDDELQELVDQLVADPIDVFTVRMDVTLE